MSTQIIGSCLGGINHTQRTSFEIANNEKRMEERRRRSIASPNEFAELFQTWEQLKNREDIEITGLCARITR